MPYSVSSILLEQQPNSINSHFTPYSDICKCEAHTKSDSVSTGNAQKDTAAKEAAQLTNIL